MHSWCPTLHLATTCDVCMAAQRMAALECSIRAQVLGGEAAIDRLVGNAVAERHAGAVGERSIPLVGDDMMMLQRMVDQLSLMQSRLAPALRGPGPV